MLFRSDALGADSLLALAVKRMTYFVSFRPSRKLGSLCHLLVGVCTLAMSAKIREKLVEKDITGVLMDALREGLPAQESWCAAALLLLDSVVVHNTNRSKRRWC